MLTPYQFASNSPIANIDLDGLEAKWYMYNIIMQQFIEVEPVLAGPVSEDVINLHGLYSESQAVKYTRDINVFNNNRKRNQARAQAYEAQRQGRELDKLNNPAYAGLKFVHDAGPTGSATQAYLNFDAGNTGTGIIYTGLTLVDLGFLLKSASLAKGIGSSKKAFTGPVNDILKNVNPLKGCINCELVALAVDRRLRGIKNAVAGGDEVADIFGVDSRLKKLFGKASLTVRVGFNGNFGDIIKSLKNGDVGIVTASATLTRKGHAFNIANIEGVITLLDGQQKIVAKTARDINSYLGQFTGSTYRLYKTN